MTLRLAQVVILGIGAGWRFQRANRYDAFLLRRGLGKVLNRNEGWE
ncbi:Hypothetical protein OINT_1001277 [Brucella intermedia LMG 3301]|uniref:Uncharacterized protein n=1 Tax=Brucella intermedia LMG 3301 TaxID=641118 RepID=C4WK46_9HYPH|nr:Hypothetical protein OINT_1001277 [Brucella intermedia LMG 3301]